MKGIPQLSILIVVFITVGCGKKYDEARIWDYVVFADYAVVSVDGKEVERIESGLLITRVPFVIVEEGKHRLGLKKKINDNSDFSDEVIYLDIEVEAQKHYEFVDENGVLQLVERKETNQPNKTGERNFE